MSAGEVARLYRLGLTIAEMYRVPEWVITSRLDQTGVRRQRTRGGRGRLPVERTVCQYRRGPGLLPGSAVELCVPAQVIVVRSQKPAPSDRGHGRHRSDEGGRKPRLVDMLATRWGYFRLPGTQVGWCDRAQPMHVPRADAWAWLPLVLAACPLSPAASLLRSPEPGALATTGTR